MDQQQFLEELDELYNAGDMEKTGGYIEKYRAWAKEQQEGAFLVMVLNEAMSFYRVTGDHGKGIEAYDEAMQVLSDLGVEDGLTMASTMLNGASAYLAGDVLEAAEQMFIDTEKMFEKSSLEDTYEAASLYNSMAILYEKLNDKEKEETYLSRALDILRSIPECRQEEMSGRCKLALLYFETEKEEEGKKQLDWAKELYAQAGGEDILPGMLGAMGAACYKAKDYEASIDFYIKAIDRTESLYGRNENWHTLMENALFVCDEVNDKEHGETLGIRAGKIKLPAIELSSRYFAECVKPVLKEKCAEFYDRITAGLAGYGSESLGYDDEYSRDDAYAPGIMIWMDRKDVRRYQVQLKKAMEEIPDNYLGIPMALQPTEKCPYRGVLASEDFYRDLIGMEKEPVTMQEWKRIPEEKLSMACSGRIFKEGTGVFMYIRRILQNYYPDEIRLEKLKEAVAAMDELTDIVYPRRMGREDAFGTYLACAEFMEHAARAEYLLNQNYIKPTAWIRKGMDNFALAADIPQYLDELSTLAMDKRPAHMNAIRVRIKEEMSAQGL